VGGNFANFVFYTLSFVFIYIYYFFISSGPPFLTINSGNLTTDLNKDIPVLYIVKEKETNNNERRAGRKIGSRLRGAFS